MKCSSCWCELTEEMFLGGLCFNCGKSTQESLSVYEIEQEQNAIKGKQLEREKEKLEQEQMKIFMEEQTVMFENHKLTTGFNFEGCKIESYLGLVSGDVVVGTGYFSDIAASISDLFGVEATAYSEKIKKAKNAVLCNMIKDSVKIGGNAIIGISYEYLTFSGNMIGVSVNGTSVKISIDNPK